MRILYTENEPLIDGDQSVIAKAKGVTDADVSQYTVDADTLHRLYNKADASSTTEKDKDGNVIPCKPAQEYVALKAKFIEQQSLASQRE